MCTAESKEEALGIMLTESLRRFPEDKFFDRNVTATQLSIEFVKQLYDSIKKED